ncbi:SRPBCC family protein [Microbacterium azadirachtae]|uniref:SRPBCC family protein n=1 Tax=Microbacterium azadirachtae TaxID=582680 RepID=UPI0035B55507
MRNPGGGAVRHVEQLDDVRTRWDTEIGGVKRTFEATITEQIPDSLIRWESPGEKVHSGQVAFTSGPVGTRVDLTLTWEPEGFLERRVHARARRARGGTGPAPVQVHREPGDGDRRVARHRERRDDTARGRVLQRPRVRPPPDASAPRRPRMRQGSSSISCCSTLRPFGCTISPCA